MRLLRAAGAAAADGGSTAALAGANCFCCSCTAMPPASSCRLLNLLLATAELRSCRALLVALAATTAVSASEPAGLAALDGALGKARLSGNRAVCLLGASAAPEAAPTSAVAVLLAGLADVSAARAAAAAAAACASAAAHAATAAAEPAGTVPWPWQALSTSAIVGRWLTQVDAALDMGGLISRLPTDSLLVTAMLLCACGRACAAGWLPAALLLWLAACAVCCRSSSR